MTETATTKTIGYTGMTMQQIMAQLPLGILVTVKSGSTVYRVTGYNESTSPVNLLNEANGRNSKGTPSQLHSIKNW